MGPRDARRLDAGHRRPLAGAAARRRGGRGSTPRRWSSGGLFGIPDDLLPPDVEAFDAYVAAMVAPGGPVRPSPVARSLAATILHPPLAPAVTRGPVAARLGPAAAPLGARPGARAAVGARPWLLVPSIGLLPDRVRDGYGFAWGPRERLLEAWLVDAWRAWRPLLSRRAGGGSPRRSPPRREPRALTGPAAARVRPARAGPPALLAASLRRAPRRRAGWGGRTLARGAAPTQRAPSPDGRSSRDAAPRLARRARAVAVSPRRARPRARRPGELRQRHERRRLRRAADPAPGRTR